MGRVQAASYTIDDKEAEPTPTVDATAADGSGHMRWRSVRKLGGGGQSDEAGEAELVLGVGWNDL